MHCTFEHGGNIHRLRRTQQDSTRPFLDFSANINPLGLADSVLAAIKTALPDVIHYPDPEGYDLKKQIAASYGMEDSMLVLGNGAVELLYVLCHTIRPQNVLIPAPSFSEYERAARSAKAHIHYFFLEKQQKFTLDAKALSMHLKGMDLCFLGNPNNPTGVLIEIDQLELIAKAAKKEGCLIVIDESFIDFLPDATPYTCRNLLQQYSNLILLQSMTKFYAIPGLRLGFMACEAGLAEVLSQAKDPWNVNSLAQTAGIAALKDKNYQFRSQSLLHKTLYVFYTQLQEIPHITAYKPTVNFILIELKKAGFTAHSLKEDMKKRGIFIRDCGNYPGLTNAFFRIAVKTFEENCILIENLKKILEKEQ